MENETSNNISNEESGQDNANSLHPLLELYVEPTQQFFSTMDNFSDSWNDIASERFKDEVVNQYRKETIDYLHSLVALTNGYEAILKEAQNLLDWKAGFGGFLSFNDIEILAERQVSRWLFNRDDQRW